jgi:hypothetical protein
VRRPRKRPRRLAGAPPDIDLAFLADALVAIGDALREIAGDAAADDALSLVLRKGLRVRTPFPSAWRNLVPRSGSKELNRLPIVARLRRLHGYAYTGEVNPTGLSSDRESKNFTSLLKDIEKLAERIPGSVDTNPLTDLLAMAKGRRELRQNHRVRPAVLALLGSVTEGHIRNLLVSGELDRFEEKKDLIDAPSARRWLRSRGRWPLGR